EPRATRATRSPARRGARQGATETPKKPHRQRASPPILALLAPRELGTLQLRRRPRRARSPRRVIARPSAEEPLHGRRRAGAARGGELGARRERGASAARLRRPRWARDDAGRRAALGAARDPVSALRAGTVRGPTPSRLAHRWGRARRRAGVALRLLHVRRAPRGRRADGAARLRLLSERRPVRLLERRGLSRPPAAAAGVVRRRGVARRRLLGARRVRRGGARPHPARRAGPAPPRLHVLRPRPGHAAERARPLRARSARARAVVRPGRPA